MDSSNPSGLIRVNAYPMQCVNIIFYTFYYLFMYIQGIITEYNILEKIRKYYI